MNWQVRLIVTAQCPPAMIFDPDVPKDAELDHSTRV